MRFYFDKSENENNTDLCPNQTIYDILGSLCCDFPGGPSHSAQATRYGMGPLPEILDVVGRSLE